MRGFGGNVAQERLAGAVRHHGVSGLAGAAGAAGHSNPALEQCHDVGFQSGALGRVLRKTVWAAGRQGDTVVFRVGDGPHFFGLTPVKAGAKPDFLSYGMTVVDFDAERVLRTLADLGIGGAQITRRGDTPELFVADADGIKI